MDTPICDFVRDYAAREPLRLHMPGHKGTPVLGPEALDLTEVEGADVLYHATGIIRQSQANAAALFGTAGTFYSAEGSSLCIRAMLYLALLHARAAGREPVILAGRNAHKTFLSGVALLDLTVDWLYPRGGSLLACPVTPADLEAAFAGPQPPTAVYLTAPDYLGNLVDTAALAAVCHRHGALLLVDNAHGAYLHFLPHSRHPMDLGADLCCDSAHKTLPVLTGGAYLHVSPTAPAGLLEQAENALALFASTSPSYLILQSLDQANCYLAQDYPQRLAAFLRGLDALKARLAAQGWTLAGDEPLKLTLVPKARGYTGQDLARALEAQGIVSEFADPDFTVMMFTPEVGAGALDRLEAALGALPPQAPVTETPPPLSRPVRRTSPRQALFSPQETLPVERCLGRVLAAPSVSCPPAVPILVCGEELDAAALACFSYYGLTHCSVVKHR